MLSRGPEFGRLAAIAASTLVAPALVLRVLYLTAHSGLTGPHI